MKILDIEVEKRLEDHLGSIPEDDEMSDCLAERPPTPEKVEKKESNLTITQKLAYLTLLNKVTKKNDIIKP